MPNKTSFFPPFPFFLVLWDLKEDASLLTLPVSHPLWALRSVILFALPCGPLMSLHTVLINTQPWKNVTLPGLTLAEAIQLGQEALGISVFEKSHLFT